LIEIATREDRVCVLNLLDAESRAVTPISHAFSGGNVVFGSSPGGRAQVLPTAVGDIPVYGSVRDGLDANLPFNTGVVFLPPSGVREGVGELIRANPDSQRERYRHREGFRSRRSGDPSPRPGRLSVSLFLPICHPNEICHCI
jgi:hypothetical protein